MGCLLPVSPPLPERPPNFSPRSSQLMKFPRLPSRRCAVLAMAAALIRFAPAQDAHPAPALTNEIAAAPVLAAMERVADWQLANPSKHQPTDWTQAAGDTGMMALAGISGNRRYRAAMVAIGEANGWVMGGLSQGQRRGPRQLPGLPAAISSNSAPRNLTNRLSITSARAGAKAALSPIRRPGKARCATSPGACKRRCA